MFFDSPFHSISLYSSQVIRDTHTYMYSACQFGPLGPGFPGPWVHWI